MPMPIAAPTYIVMQAKLKCVDYRTFQTAMPQSLNKWFLQTLMYGYCQASITQQVVAAGLFKRLCPKGGLSTQGAGGTCPSQILGL